MSRFSNDADYVQQMLEQSIVSVFSSALLFVGIVAVMLFTCAPLFLVTLFVLAASFFAIRIIGGRSRKLYQRQQQALGEMNGNIQEMIEGLRVVKAFTHEDAAKAQFGKLNNAYFDVAKDANFYATAMMPIVSNVMNIGYALTAIVGGLFAFGGMLDLGGLAIYLQFGRQISQPMSQISQQMTSLLSALAGAERIFDVLDMPPEVDEGEVTLEQSGRDYFWVREDGERVPLRGDVRFYGVDFSYVPEKPVLRDLSLYAKPGQKIAFVGSTGAGKTTITNLLNRFYDIDEGTITIDGVNIRDIKRDVLRENIAMVLQDTHLFTGTVMENIRYGRPDATDEEVIEAAKTASAHSFIMRLNDNYQTMLEGDGANLSQGQRQLLNIARAALSRAPILVLDEATSSVDTRTERHIEHGMDRLMKNRTTFIIAHRLSTVRNADAIMVLEHGEIIERGNHEQLLAQKGRYYELYTGKRELD
mgnify:CR=1 FL=1